MTTVLIWNNHLYGSNAYPGHASMSIDDQWTRSQQNVSYVSWWPTDGSEAIEKHNPQPMLSISADLQEECYAPDHILQFERRLNETGMMGKWNTIRHDPTKKYRFLRANCSTIVSQVLKEGTTAGSVVDRHNLVWTPLKLRRLATAMGAREITWAEFLSDLFIARYLSGSDSAVLKNLFKRDERHGKNATENAFYYSGGRQVNPKANLQWKNFHVGPQTSGTPFFESSEGSLLSSGTIHSIGNNLITKEYNTGVENRRI